MRAAEMLTCKERVGVLDDPLPRHRPRPGAEAARRPRDRLPRSGAGLGGPAAADPAGPGGAADPARGRRGASLRARAARGPGPRGLARRLLEPCQPPPRAGHDAARRDPQALAGRGLRPRLRLRRRRAATAGPCANSCAKRPRPPRSPARRRTSCSSSASRTRGAVSRRRWRSRGCPSSSAGSSSWCAGRTPARSSSSSSPPAGRSTSRAEVEANADAIFWTAHLGTFAGDAIADILAGIVSPTARLSHGLPFADGITSGFDTRQARIDRPAVPVVRGSAMRRAAPPLVRLLPRPRRPLAGGLPLRRGLLLHQLRALRLVARHRDAFGRGRHARSPPASG